MLQKNIDSLVIVLTLFLIGCSNTLEEAEGISALSIESNWVIREIAASPDDRYLAFTAETDTGHAIFILNIESGASYPIQELDDRILNEAQGPA